MRGLNTVSVIALLAAMTAPAYADYLVPTYNGAMINASQSQTIAPTGNGTATESSFVISGPMISATTREMLIAFGATSNVGAGLSPAVGGDKVLLYNGIICNPGSGDCWSFNPLLTASPGFTKNAYVNEFDLNNNAYDAALSLSYPGIWNTNYSINGLLGYHANGAQIISAGGGSHFRIGEVFTNNAVSDRTIWDNTFSTNSFYDSGFHQYGVNLGFGNYAGGQIVTLGAITAGSGYVNGTYNGVPLTGGAGSGATATVVVSGGAVTAVYFESAGVNYAAANSLSASNANLGGSGSGFAVAVSTVSSAGDPMLVPNNTYLDARNAAGNATYHMLGVNNGNNLVVGYQMPLVIMGANTQPITDGAYSSGNGSNRWSDVFSVAFHDGAAVDVTLVCDGVTDIGATLNTALSTYAGYVVRVPKSASDCMTSVPILVPANTILTGSGASVLNGSIGKPGMGPVVKLNGNGAQVRDLKIKG